MERKPEIGPAGAEVTPIEVTPEGIEAGIAAAREWLARPENYWVLETGGEGDLASLVREVVLGVCKASLVRRAT